MKKQSNFVVVSKFQKNYSVPGGINWNLLIFWEVNKLITLEVVIFCNIIIEVYLYFFYKSKRLLLSISFI